MEVGGGKKKEESHSSPTDSSPVSAAEEIVNFFQWGIKKSTELLQL